MGGDYKEDPMGWALYLLDRCGKGKDLMELTWVDLTTKEGLHKRAVFSDPEIEGNIALEVYEARTEDSRGNLKEKHFEITLAKKPVERNAMCVFVVSVPIDTRQADLLFKGHAVARKLVGPMLEMVDEITKGTE